MKSLSMWGGACQFWKWVLRPEFGGDELEDYFYNWNGCMIGGGPKEYSLCRLMLWNPTSRDPCKINVDGAAHGCYT